jgi:hypothetical protein
MPSPTIAIRIGNNFLRIVPHLIHQARSINNANLENAVKIRHFADASLSELTRIQHHQPQKLQNHTGLAARSRARDPSLLIASLRSAAHVADSFDRERDLEGQGEGQGKAHECGFKRSNIK